MKLEREIAREHLGHFPWFSLAWAFINFAVWIALWPLVLMDILPLWAGFGLATISISLSYLPCHEAQHDIFARPGARLRWLNELVGHMGSLPLTLPYRVLRATHMEHHKHTNHPELDPDAYTHAQTAWQAVWQHIKARQPRMPDGLEASYVATLERLNRNDLKVDLLLYTFGFYGFLFAMAWSGYAIEAALLWWLPRHLAVSYIVFFLSWAPHYPGKETGRYKDTRGWRSIWGNIGSMGMQFHIVHHLYPRIPLYRTPRAYWQMRPILEARGCDISGL